MSNELIVKERTNYLDYLKTIAIILVVYVHYAWVNDSKGSNITMLMTIIAVPIFFMVNGALLMSKNFDIHRHIKKMSSIFISLVTWKLIILIICILIKRVNIQDFYILYQQLT